jgi:hypothetical protein
VEGRVGVAVAAPVVVGGGEGLPDPQEEMLTDAVELCEDDPDPVKEGPPVLLTDPDPVAERTAEAEYTPLGDSVPEGVREENDAVPWPVEEAAVVSETVTEGDRELLIVAVVEREPLGLPEGVRMPVLDREGEGDPVTVLPLRVTVSVGDPRAEAVLEGLAVDVVLWELLAETETLADPELVGLPPADGLTEGERVSFVGEAVKDATAEIVGDAVTVSGLPDGVIVVERAGLIVCVRVSKRVRVDVLVTRSVGETLTETQRETSGV